MFSIQFTLLTAVQPFLSLGQFLGSTQCFAFAASDGTVAISHVNSDGSWGIHNSYNQIMLPQRCIGLGTIEHGPQNNIRHLCCCLRGGTIFVLPVNEHVGSLSTFRHDDLTMYVVPFDPSGEDDGLVRFVQNFASGVVHVTPWDDISRNAEHATNLDDRPVALVGWNGGVIDVYEISCTVYDHDDDLFQQLIDKGLIVDLVEKLLVVNRNHPIISSSLWRKAWDECNNQNKNINSILKGIKDASTSNFTSTRELIMSLIE